MFTYPKKIKALSLDGGGVRGLYTLCVLKRLEEIHSFKTHSLFDVFGGTSTGGILALAYGAGHTTEELLEMYKTEIPAVFTKSWIKFIMSGFGLLDEKYSNKALKKIFVKYLGTRQLTELNKPVFVTSVNVTKNAPVVIGPGTIFNAVEAGLATSAAPTYFEPLIKHDEAYVDGGLLANNPSTVVAAAIVKAASCPVNAINLLSIGTGYHVDGISADAAESMGILEWAGPIAGTMMSAESAFFHDLSQTLLPKRYLRVNSLLSHSIDLASTVETELDELRNKGRAAAEAITPAQLEFLLT